MLDQSDQRALLSFIILFEFDTGMNFSQVVTKLKNLKLTSNNVKMLVKLELSNVYNCRTY